CREPIGRGRVDATPVGLDLERDPRGREDLENLPAMRDPERLTAPEGNEGNAGFRDAAREVERLVAGELVRPRFVRAGLLAARETARAAAVGQLPGKKKGRPVLIDRTPRHCESGSGAKIR